MVFVAYGERGSGLGLIGSASMPLKGISNLTIISKASNILTRFSGIIMF